MTVKGHSVRTRKLESEGKGVGEAVLDTEAAEDSGLAIGFVGDVARDVEEKLISML
jgi:hypothetical protein